MQSNEMNVNQELVYCYNLLNELYLQTPSINSIYMSAKALAYAISATQDDFSTSLISFYMAYVQSLLTYAKSSHSIPSQYEDFNLIKELHPINKSKSQISFENDEALLLNIKRISMVGEIIERAH